MKPDIQLRLLLWKADTGATEAQLLEPDICVGGANAEMVLKELRHALVVSYEIAIDHGQVPFVQYAKAPGRFHNWYADSPDIGADFILLPINVGEALAKAMNVIPPIGSACRVELLVRQREAFGEKGTDEVPGLTPPARAEG